MRGTEAEDRETEEKTLSNGEYGKGKSANGIT